MLDLYLIMKGTVEKVDLHNEFVLNMLTGFQVTDTNVCFEI